MPEQAVDGNIDTYFHPALLITSTEADLRANWLQVDFQMETPVSRVTLSFRPPIPNLVEEFRREQNEVSN